MNIDFRKIKFKKIIYPVISGIIVIIIVVIFVYVADFLVKAIDKAFVIDEKRAESLLVKIDMFNFQAVAKKLGISANQPITNDLQPTTNNQQQITITTTTVAETAATTTSTLDKKAVKIAVYNSTGIKGLANELKTVLEADGFVMEKTGNISESYATTTIKIKESKKDYTSLIKESVSKKHQLGDDQILAESEIYDIIIIIGVK